LMFTTHKINPIPCKSDWVFTNEEHKKTFYLGKCLKLTQQTNKQWSVSESDTNTFMCVLQMQFIVRLVLVNRIRFANETTLRIYFQTHDQAWDSFGMKLDRLLLNSVGAGKVCFNRMSFTCANLFIYASFA